VDDPRLWVGDLVGISIAKDQCDGNAEYCCHARGVGQQPGLDFTLDDSQTHVWRWVRQPISELLRSAFVLVVKINQDHPWRAASGIVKAGKMRKKD